MLRVHVPTSPILRKLAEIVEIVFISILVASSQINNLFAPFCESVHDEFNEDGYAILFVQDGCLSFDSLHP